MTTTPTVSQMGQVFIGGVVVVACLAQPWLLIFVALFWLIRMTRRAAQGRRSRSVAAGGVIVILALGVSYALPQYAVALVLLALGGITWLAVGQVRAQRLPRGVAGVAGRALSP